MTTTTQQYLCELLHCKPQDLHYLDKLVDRYQIDFSIADVLQSHRHVVVININHIIHEAYRYIAESFLSANDDTIRQMTDIYHMSEIEYQVYTNYCDSRIWFSDSAVHALYQQWKPKALRREYVSLHS